MARRLYVVMFPAILAFYMPVCTSAVRPTLWPKDAAIKSLWEGPASLPDRDLFNGPWGAKRAPDPHARYALIDVKHHGINPGMTVRDPQGHKWSVKQSPSDGQPGEGPTEVVLSRVLSAIGYHQPPVYYLPSFTLVDDWGQHVERGGRFRLHEKTLKDAGEWSWQQNPFVGTRPYQGLLVVLLLFNSSDLKNSNNTLYQHRIGDAVEPWYVVRDLGAALGATARIAPRRGDPDAFEQSRFILDVRDGFVRFDYHGWHQELVRSRITSDDVAWATGLLSRLSDRQWHEAFRAAGQTAGVADRFIQTIQSRIAQGQELGGSTGSRVGEGIQP